MHDMCAENQADVQLAEERANKRLSIDNFEKREQQTAKVGITTSQHEQEISLNKLSQFLTTMPRGRPKKKNKLTNAERCRCSRKKRKE